MSANAFIRRIKPYLRWLVVAATLGFLLHSLRQNWQQVLTLRFTAYGTPNLAIATGVTLLAHIWSGWVWHQMIRLLGVPVGVAWSTIVYLKTNIAKYLPGNVWHFWGRIQALRSIDTPIGVAVTGVVLEPLLMAAAALAVVVVGQPSAIFQAAILVGVLIGVHPRILNPVLKSLSKAKLKQRDLVTQPITLGLSRYPVGPLVGEVLFVLLRGTGFLLVLSALEPIPVREWWFVMSNFSLAWLVGLVVPGAPGGLGMFEAVSITLLGDKFPSAVVLGAVALYRLISTAAEGLGAALAAIDEKWDLMDMPIQARGEQPVGSDMQAPDTSTADG